MWREENTTNDMVLYLPRIHIAPAVTGMAMMSSIHTYICSGLNNDVNMLSGCIFTMIAPASSQYGKEKSITYNVIEK